VYVDAADPDRAYRSIAAQFLTENTPDAVEVEIPGGRLTTDKYGSGAIMLLEGTVVITDGTDAQTVANLVTGAGPTLADFDPFTKVMDAQSGDPLIRAFVNGPAATRSAAGGFLPYYGYGGLGYREIALFGALAAPVTGTYTSVGISATDGGFLLSSAQLPAPLIGPELPKGHPSDELVSEVSNTADLFVGGRDLNRNSRFTQIIDMIVISAATSSGAYPDQPTIDVRAWAYDEIERRTGIDLRADLLDQIHGDYVVAGALESVDRLSDVNVVIRTDLGDADTVADTVGKLATLLRVATSDLAGGTDQLELTESQVGEDTLYTLSAREDGETVTYSFGVIDGQLLASLGDGMSLLDGSDSKSLADDPGYQDAISKLPEQDGAPFYLDVHELISLAGLTYVDAPADWGLPGDELIPLGGFLSVAGMTYAKGGLAHTDLFLSLSGNVPAPAGTPSTDGAWAPYPGASGLAVTDVANIDVGDGMVRSVSPDGTHAIVVNGDDQLCLIPLHDTGAERCVTEMTDPNVEWIQFAWSPDSRKVAFTESIAFRMDSDIWVLDVASGEIRNLTDDGFEGELSPREDVPGQPDHLPRDIAPIFSPDGSEIYFTRTNWPSRAVEGDVRAVAASPSDLYRISIDGGEPILVTRLTDHSALATNGLIWGSDGTLVVALYLLSAEGDPTYATSLWSVDVMSGEVEELWVGEDDDNLVQPLATIPGGGVILYSPKRAQVRSDSDGGCPYAVLDPASQAVERLADQDGNCRWILSVSPDGSMAITSDPYGDARLANTSLLDLVTGDAQLFDLSAALDAIPDLDDDQPDIFTAHGRNAPMTWTADGAIYLIIDDTHLVRVQLSAGQDQPPASPAAQAGSHGMSVAEATAIDVGGRRVHSVSPDGTRAVVKGEGRDEVCIVALDGFASETCTDQISGLDVSHIAWSPDSATVALTEDSARYMRDGDIWIIDAGSGQVRNLTDDSYAGAIPLSSDEEGVPDPLPVDYSPIFTTDGTAIIFARTEWGSGRGPSTDLYRVSLDGAQPERIARFGNEPLVAWYGAIWVEDSTLLISYGSSDRDEPRNGLWTVDVDSGDLEQVWHGNEQHYVVTPVAQRPDGSVVVVFPVILSQYQASSDVCPAAVLDFQSGEAVPIRDGAGQCTRLLGVSPDGALAIVSGGPEHGFWTVNLDSLEATEFDIEAIHTAVGADDAIVIAGAETQPLAWTSDNVLTFVINLTVPVRVTLQSGT
jgi:Tol biopolymer transport system component